MVAAIRASDHARDFKRTVLAEGYFRAAAHPTLTVMLDKAEFITSISPALWRETLARHGVEIALLKGIDERTQRIETELFFQSQARVEEAKRQGADATMDSVISLMMEMQSNGIDAAKLGIYSETWLTIA